MALSLTYLEQSCLIAAGFWLFVITLAVACIVAGMAGDRVSRRHGRMCPECDYRGNQVDVVIHHALEHFREH